MVPSFLAKQKTTSSLVLLVDIGSSSVGASIAKVEKGNPGNIIASVREDIPFQSVLSSHRFLLAMAQTLEKALKNLQANTKTIGRVDHIYCTLSSPWFILKTRNMHVTRPTEFEVNEKTLAEFIDEDVAVLKEELKATLPPQDVRVIEKKIIQMKLNGYDIKNPYKQRTASMELSTTIGISSNKVIETIEKKIHHFYHITAVHFGAFPVAAFSAIRDIFPHEKNFLFLDITGEATDVSLVMNDMLMGTLSFARGRNYFIREISSKLNTVHEEAATLFAMYLRGELSGDRHDQIEQIIAQCEKGWMDRLGKTLTLLGEENVLPRKIFFTVDAELVSLFSKNIKTLRHELLVGESFEAQYLDQMIISKFVSYDAGLARDPFMVVEALFAQKLIEQHS